MLLFNRYQYDPKNDLIGKGGFSRVYKARDKKLNRWVALKIYKTSNLAERYSPIAEIQRVINLEHPNICRYIDIEEIENEDAFGETEKIQVCVLELLDGGNFLQYFNANKDLNILRKLIIDVLNGLSYLHRNGVIHRDIKPANILIKETIDGPVAKITDFGISKRSDSSGNSTSSALIVSIPYMAPEQLNVQKYGIDEKVSYNIDLWSLGVTVYEIISGRVLFKNSPADSSEQIMANIMMPELPEKINLLPEPFLTFVSRCIIKDARLRAKSTEELISFLEQKNKKPEDTDAKQILQDNPFIQPEAKELPGNTESQIEIKKPESETDITIQGDELPSGSAVLQENSQTVFADPGEIEIDQVMDAPELHKTEADGPATSNIILTADKPETEETGSILFPASHQHEAPAPIVVENNGMKTDGSPDTEKTVTIIKDQKFSLLESNDQSSIDESFDQGLQPQSHSPELSLEDKSPDNVDETQILDLKGKKQQTDFIPAENKEPQNLDETQVLHLTKKEEKNAATISGIEETQNPDDTRILHLTKKSQQPEPTPLEDKVSEAEVLPDTDETQILLSPKEKEEPAVINTKKDEPENVDETQVLNKKIQKDTALSGRKEPEVADDSDSIGQQLTAPGGKKEKPITLFNRYDYYPITDLIGKGGFSRVYKAFDNKLSRWVALKIYKSGDFAENYSPIAEIKRVVNLDHSNICRYLDIEEIEKENPFGENEKTQVCVMELLDGGNFAEYFKKNKDPETLRKVLQDVLHGLSYLHKKGIIHRDIKPANILIKETVEGPVAKITDFGISKSSETVSNHSSSSLIVSIPYMAPEQLNIKKYGIQEKISYNLDLWSLGVTVYEVITGKVLFKNSDQDSSEQIMTNIMAPELPEKIHDLSEPFRTIVSKCIIKNAAERAQKADDLLVLLNTIPIGKPPQKDFSKANEDTENIHDTSKRKSVIFLSEEDQPASHTKKIRHPNSIINIEKEEETPISKPSMFSSFTNKIQRIDAKRRQSILLVLLAMVPIIFLLVVIFRKDENIPSAISKKPAGSTKAPDSSSRQQGNIQPVPPSVNQATATTKAADTIAAKKNTPTAPKKQEERRKENVDANRGNTTQSTDRRDPTQKYNLRLSANKACIIKINQIENGRSWDFQLRPGRTSSIRLNPGRYFLQAISAEDNSVYNANLRITNDNMGESGRHSIYFK